MKIRYILIAIIAVVLFNNVSTAMRRSDFHHCRVTSHMTINECQEATGYKGE
nr:MAG TPA: hypothetical protein [Bacteriophage sp.]